MSPEYKYCLKESSSKVVLKEQRLFKTTLIWHSTNTPQRTLWAAAVSTTTLHSLDAALGNDFCLNPYMQVMLILQFVNKFKDTKLHQQRKKEKLQGIKYYDVIKCRALFLAAY
jgi:hypothetical protein